MKKVFITGGSGFIGRHLIEQINSQFDIIVLTRKASDFKNENKNLNVEIIEGNLLHAESYRTYLSSCSHLVHIAGEKSNQEKMFEVNVSGTEILVEEAIMQGIKQIIYISSSGVYGINENPDKIITENSTCYPSNDYEKSKLASEMLLMRICKNKKANFSILRPSNVIGETDKGRKLLNLFRALQKDRFFYLDKNAIVNYVYVKSVAESIIELIKLENQPNEIYNVNAPMNIVEFIEELKLAININTKIKIFPKFAAFLMAGFMEILPDRIRLFDFGRYRELTNKKQISNAKIEILIPVNQTEMLKKGIHNLAAFYRNQGLL